MLLQPLPLHRPVTAASDRICSHLILNMVQASRRQSARPEIKNSWRGAISVLDIMLLLIAYAVVLAASRLPVLGRGPAHRIG
jgi:hypothetical protein